MVAARDATLNPRRKAKQPTTKSSTARTPTPPAGPTLTAAQHASASAKRAAERRSRATTTKKQRGASKGPKARAAATSRRRDHVEIYAGDRVVVDLSGYVCEATVLSCTPTHADLEWMRGAKVKRAQVKRTQIRRVARQAGYFSSDAETMPPASRTGPAGPVRPLSQPDTRDAKFVPAKAPIARPAGGFQPGARVMFVVGGVARIGTVQRVITQEEVVVTYPTASGAKTSAVRSHRLRPCRA